MYNVMVVDDEQLTRNFLKTIIHKNCDEWTVIGEASDGCEALTMLKDNKCDLVITDIKMPIMDGVTLCQHISELHPDTRLIILSGYGEFEYAKKAIQCNVSAYLLKPIVNEDLFDALNTVKGQLDNSHRTQEAFVNYSALSSKYKDELATKLLQSIVNNAYVQTQSLLKIIYQLDVSLIEEQALIMMIVPSKSMMLQADYLQNKEVASLLIYMTVCDMLDGSSAIAFLDSSSRTVIYIPINESESPYEIRNDLCVSLCADFFSATGEELECYSGSPVTELLQLNQSYQEAIVDMQKSRLFVKPDYATDKVLGRFNELLANYVYAVKSRVNDNIQYSQNELEDFISSNLGMLNMDYVGIHTYEYLIDTLDDDSSFAPPSTSLDVILDGYSKLYNTASEDSSEDSLIDDAIEYIQNHYSEPISLAILADHLSITPSYLSNLFHTTVGTSYIKYLTELRINKACYMLSHNKDITLDTITKKVGYLSTKHFSYVFKKHYGITPGRYRSEH